MSRELVRVQPPEAAPAPRPLRVPTLSWEAVAYLALGLLTATAVVLTDQGWFTPDTKPEVYLAPLRTLTRMLSTWDPDPHLGQPNFQTGLLPVSVVVSVPQLVAWRPRKISPRFERAFGRALVVGAGVARKTQP